MSVAAIDDFLTSAKENIVVCLECLYLKKQMKENNDICVRDMYLTPEMQEEVEQRLAAFRSELIQSLGFEDTTSYDAGGSFKK